MLPRATENTAAGHMCGLQAANCPPLV